MGPSSIGVAVNTRARAGFVEILTCTLMWGTIGPIAKQLDVPSRVIVFFRLLLGFAVVVCVLALTRKISSARLRARPVLMIASGVVLAVHWAALFESYKRLTIATAILIVFLGPVLMAVAAPSVLGERLRPLSVAALAVAFGGIALIALPDVREIDLVGLLCALVSAVLFAVLMLIGKLLTEHYEPAAITVWQLGVAAAVMSPALIGADAGEIVRAAPGLLLLGAVYSGLLGIVFFHAVRALQAQQLGVLFYLEPAAAVVFSWWWLAERPSATTLIGGALIIAAGLAIIVSDRRAAAVATPEVPV